jgi:hypothetical protein
MDLLSRTQAQKAKQLAISASAAAMWIGTADIPFFTYDQDPYRSDEA